MARPFKITGINKVGGVITEVSSKGTGAPKSTFVLTKSSANVTSGAYAPSTTPGGTDVGDAELDTATWDDLLPFAKKYDKKPTSTVIFNMYWRAYTSISYVEIS